MDWIKIMQWVSIVMCWAACGLNIFAMIRLNRCRKWYEKKNEELSATEKYYNTMIAACTEFLEAAHKESDVTDEVSDEGEN